MRHNRRRGFTIVELNLSMIFVALLLMGVAALTIHVTRIYQRGVMIKEVNQVGREVMSQVRNDIAGATPSAVTVSSDANTGRMCLGNVSYVYNTAQGLKSDGPSLFTRGAGDSAPRISLVRIIDPIQRWCREDESGAFGAGTDVSAEFAAGNASELIMRDGFAPIALHSMTLQQYGTGPSARQALYELTVRLGTAELDFITDGACNPPTHSQSDFDACFVSDHTTLISAGGVKSEQ